MLGSWFGNFKVDWWKGVEQRLATCDKCVRGKQVLCGNQHLIDPGMIPSWTDSHGEIDVEQKSCGLWLDHVASTRMRESGVPEVLIEQKIEASDKDEELLDKLRRSYIKRCLLGVVGDQNKRLRALALMTRYLAARPERKFFRVAMLDLKFRTEMNEYHAHHGANPLFDWGQYKRCLFVVVIGARIQPDWARTEVIEMLMARMMNRLPTVVLDASPDMLHQLKGSGEALGCRV